MSHLLTVFRVCEDNHADVDVAILQALLKGGEFTCQCIAVWLPLGLKKKISASK